VQAQFSEAYKFNVKSDDGVRLWVNGKKVIDTWNNLNVTNKTIPIQLEAGKKYAITMDHFESTGTASAMLMWRSASTAKVIIPTTQLYGNLTPVPGPWLQADIGSTPIAGSATLNSGLFTINGSGRRIGKEADNFRFVYRSLSGNGTITARVLNVLESDPQARGGVMIRQDLTAGSPFALMGLTAGGEAVLQSRTTAGGTATKTVGATGQSSSWVRLVRSGNRLTGFRSTDGVTFTQVGFVDITMGTNVSIGLAVSAHSDTILNTSLMDSVAVA
jgi:hypothetical protein